MNRSILMQLAVIATLITTIAGCVQFTVESKQSTATLAAYKTLAQELSQAKTELDVWVAMVRYEKSPETQPWGHGLNTHSYPDGLEMAAFFLNASKPKTFPIVQQTVQKGHRKDMLVQAFTIVTGVAPTTQAANTPPATQSTASAARSVARKNTLTSSQISIQQASTGKTIACPDPDGSDCTDP